jgi:hypothetical protein
MTRDKAVATALADAFLAAIARSKVSRAAPSCLGRKRRWIEPLARRVFQFGSALVSATARTDQWIARDEGYRNAWYATRVPRVVHYFLDPPPMAPRVGALAACHLPSIATPGDLATRLGLTIGELDWFSDVRQVNPAQGPLCHYRYNWIAKQHGSRLVAFALGEAHYLSQQVKE